MNNQLPFGPGCDSPQLHQRNLLKITPKMGDFFEIKTTACEERLFFVKFLSICLFFAPV